MVSDPGPSLFSRRSLEAVRPVGSHLTFCSTQARWRSVLLRSHADARIVEDYETTATPDQKIVLVTKGACRIESRRGGVWHGADCRPGHVGLVPPHEVAQLRWHGEVQHHTLQLHLPGTLIEGVAGELFATGRAAASLSQLSLVDPVVAATILGLERAARMGAPDIHAETTAHFLASHLLLRASRLARQAAPAHDRSALERVEDAMRARLSEPVTLGELAAVAELSRFQLLRAAKRGWGETPQRRLTRLRMEHAQRLLLSRRLTVIEIALECGYGNPSHFATAFRRCVGLSPAEFRRSV